MSYDQLKDTGASPPVYPYPTGPGQTVGYQLADRSPPVGLTNIHQYDSPPPPPPPNRGQDDDEQSETPEKDPSTVSVAHLNVSSSALHYPASGV